MEEITTSNCLVSTLFRISSLVFNRRKKLIQGWNNLRVSINDDRFIFLGELSLKLATCLVFRTHPTDVLGQLTRFITSPKMHLLVGHMLSRKVVYI